MQRLALDMCHVNLLVIIVMILIMYTSQLLSTRQGCDDEMIQIFCRYIYYCVDQILDVYACQFFRIFFYSRSTVVLRP